ncbi:hypothetical protein V2J09_019457 [Rumex salicifolius]
MDSSWSFDSDKGFMLSNGAISPPDLLNTRSKNEFTNCGLKGFSYGYEFNSMMISSQQIPLENQGNLGVGYTGMTRKQSSHDSMRNCMSSIGSGGGDLINMHNIASNAISGDDESSSRLSNSVVDSNGKESSLIDLKLGRLGDNLSIQNATISTTPVISCADSSTPAKRVKASSLNSQPAFCQVYGCNKDLGSSKDYHKRHKVCDVHSKTAKVIVNGIEQRFCQQCSRFHLLGEFDDGKRSCRRRLAGHNERRRKPQVGMHSGRTGRLIHSYNGFGTTSPNETATSFICQDILPKSITPSHFEKFGGAIDFSKHPKLQQACSWIDGQFLQKPLCPYTESLNTSTLTAYEFNENSFNQYHPHNNGSCSVFQNNNIYDTASTVEGLSELAANNKSGCALSLLSSQPQSSSGMPSSSSHPLMGSSHHNFGLSEVSEDTFGVNSLDLSNGVSRKYQQLSSVPLSNGNGNVGSGFGGGFLHGSEYVNTEGGPSFNGGGATIDLLQLSSQLQRVEHHRQAVSVKQEDDTFCCLKIT